MSSNQTPALWAENPEAVETIDGSLLDTYFLEYVRSRPEIADEAKNLREQTAATTTWDAETFTRYVRLRREIAEDLDVLVENLALHGSSLEQDVLEGTLSDLGDVERLLRCAENDPVLLVSVLAATRNEFTGKDRRDNIDERPVTVALHSGELAGPNDHVLVELVRLLAIGPDAGGPFNGTHRIVTMPRWLLELLETYQESLHVHVEGHIAAEFGDGVVAAANALWSPSGENGPYASFRDAIEAAKLLTA